MLSIIIVNYRSAPLLLNALQSLYQYNKTSFEVIVADNNSGDNSRELILSSFPNIVWLEMGYNAGFARANNAGMRTAKGDAFLLLNPDTIALDNAVEQCYKTLMESEYAAAGVQLLNEDLSNQASGSFFVRGGLNHILPIPYWGGFIRWMGYSTNAKVPGVLQSKAVEEVDWINGAFLMVKKSAVGAAGFMDEDFFLYAEEIEWCSRLRKKGKLCIFGDLKMIHLQGETINKEQGSPDKGYYNLYDKKGLQLMVSNHVRIRKQYGKGWFLFLLINYSWGIVAFFTAATIHQIMRLKNPVTGWKRVGAFAGNVWRLWKLVPVILRNKPYFYKMF